ncbi:alpha/beta hydrolase [Nonomuraea fastidiosa]|uniref:alpha/beta hydrolase n=1 Tax=Nonomuraea fastidiosa TaxID=46173 RepID=UPI00366DDDAE
MACQADARLLDEIAEREFAAQEVTGAVVHARDTAHLRSLLAERETAVVLPGPGDRALAGRVPEPPVTVWVDIERTDTAPAHVRRIQGRGVQGLAWGIRHAVHRMRHPGILRVPYGPAPDQWADLYLPQPSAHGTRPAAPASDAGDRPSAGVRSVKPASGHHCLPDPAPGAAGPPVVTLIHGGYWRSIWAADLMEPLCADLLQRGFAVWNVEYRRPDLHGWDATTEDVATALSTLHTTARGEMDLSRVAVAGHSAGGQLALRAAADGAGVALAVSLAGVLDLEAGDRRWLSAGAVAHALGHPSHEPGTGRYAASSPLLRVPLGVPQLVVQGAEDDLDLVDFSRRYAVAARAAGDDVTYLELPGHHFDVINPESPIWRATASAITAALA